MPNDWTSLEFGHIKDWIPLTDTPPNPKQYESGGLLQGMYNMLPDWLTGTATKEDVSGLSTQSRLANTYTRPPTAEEAIKGVKPKDSVQVTPEQEAAYYKNAEQVYKNQINDPNPLKRAGYRALDVGSNLISGTLGNMPPPESSGPGWLANLTSQLYGADAQGLLHAGVILPFAARGKLASIGERSIAPGETMGRVAQFESPKPTGWEWEHQHRFDPIIMEHQPGIKDFSQSPYGPETPENTLFPDDLRPDAETISFPNSGMKLSDPNHPLNRPDTKPTLVKRPTVQVVGDQEALNQNELWNTQQQNSARMEGRNINDIVTPLTKEQQQIDASYKRIQAEKDKYNKWFHEQESKLPEGRFFRPSPDTEAAFGAKIEQMTAEHKKLVDRLMGKEKSGPSVIDIPPAGKQIGSNVKGIGAGVEKSLGPYSKYEVEDMINAADKFGIDHSNMRNYKQLEEALNKVVVNVPGSGPMTRAEAEMGLSKQQIKKYFPW